MSGCHYWIHGRMAFAKHHSWTRVARSESRDVFVCSRCGADKTVAKRPTAEVVK